ncbi:hypothetical protein KW782_02790 [Candidatus Parcubacteria bacterium]|nr:hypothetical protein [Candidatus Parcubacteria bacterium]
MSKFAHCHESEGLMWCMYPSGKWAKPFPATNDKKEDDEVAKDPSDDESQA